MVVSLAARAFGPCMAARKAGRKRGATGCRRVRLDARVIAGHPRGRTKGPPPKGLLTKGPFMYPLIRFAKELVKFRNAPALDPLGTHVSTHMCWPWDLDPWWELNNGRTLTLFDLGRMPLSVRLGMVAALKANGWGMTAAGNTVRYRRRVRMFHRVQMHSRLIGWDARFVYVEQAMWRGGEALNHILVRLAATDAQGIMPPHRLITAMGHKGTLSPALPDWVTAWIAADATRPWPPAVGAQNQNPRS